MGETGNLPRGSKDFLFFLRIALLVIICVDMI